MVERDTQAAGSTTETVVEVEDVHTRFGDTVVHAGVSLSVNRGEIFAIVGGSGSGKSVLLREIIMLHRPRAGRIRVFGQDVVGLPASRALAIRRRIGMLFQRGALFTSLDVLENIAVPMWEHTKLDQRTARELAAVKLALVGLPPEAGVRYPSELSGGMQKRAGLARALALDPELVFLDEPTAGLDPDSAAAFDALVAELKRSMGLTVVMVTHDLDSLWQIADRAIMLGEGQVIASGSVADLAASDHPLAREYFHGPRGRAAHEASWKHD